MSDHDGWGAKDLIRQQMMVRDPYFYLPKKCRNCGAERLVHNYIVEECPICGDEGYSLIEPDAEEAGK